MTNLNTIMNSQNKRIMTIVLIVALILLIPLVAMQFTDEVRWDMFDFVVMGVLLLVTGLLCEIAIRKVKPLNFRIGIIAVILITFLLMWAELAVGIFGTPFAGS